MQLAERGLILYAKKMQKLFFEAQICYIAIVEVVGLIEERALFLC
jgi:hypothetical protein